MTCADCHEDNVELVRCDVCGRLVCTLCFYDLHDGANLPFVEWPELRVETSVDSVN